MVFRRSFGISLQNKNSNCQRERERLEKTNVHYIVDVSDILGLPNSVAVCTTSCAVDNPIPCSVYGREKSFTYVGRRGNNFERVIELPRIAGGFTDDGIYEFRIQPLPRSLTPIEEVRIHKKLRNEKY